MQRMIAEQGKEINEMQGDFSNASSLMQEKYNRLTENMSEL